MFKRYEKNFFSLSPCVDWICRRCSDHRPWQVYHRQNACTITRKSDGKTFPLHGRVEIVDHNPDLRVEIVDHNPDIYVMAHYPCDCGEYELVDHNPDLRIELVDHNPDLTVEVRDHHPHINR